MSARIVDGKIYNISVFDKSFQTKEGISVGDTLRDVKSKYKKVNVFGGEGHVVAAPKDQGVSFVLDKETTQLLKKSKRPEDSKIVSILLTGNK